MVFELYGSDSGAKINVQKSEIISIGWGRLLEDERKLIIVTDTNILKILGVYFGINKVELKI